MPGNRGHLAQASREFDSTALLLIGLVLVELPDAAWRREKRARICPVAYRLLLFAQELESKSGAGHQP